MTNQYEKQIKSAKSAAGKIKIEIKNCKADFLISAANTHVRLVKLVFPGGFSLLLKQNGVYNITDTVNGAFDKDALICGEESNNALSVVGQGSADNSGRFYI